MPQTAVVCVYVCDAFRPWRHSAAGALIDLLVVLRTAAAEQGSDSEVRVATGRRDQSTHGREWRIFLGCRSSRAPTVARVPAAAGCGVAADRVRRASLDRQAGLASIRPHAAFRAELELQPGR
eukprot:3657966-Prymnesium_polylepis.1